MKLYNLGNYGIIDLQDIKYITITEDEKSFEVIYKNEPRLFVDLISGIEIMSVYTAYLRDKVLLGT